MLIYLAAPMHPDGDEVSDYMERNARIAKKLEKAGFSVYLPQRDTDQTHTPKKIVEANMASIRGADCVVVLLADTWGIFLEAGYARALGRTVVAVREEGTRPLGSMVRNFFDYIVDSTDELAVLLKGLDHDRSDDR